MTARTYVAGAAMSLTFGTTEAPLPPLPVETLRLAEARIRKYAPGDPADLLGMLDLA